MATRNVIEPSVAAELMQRLMPREVVLNVVMQAGYGPIQGGLFAKERVVLDTAYDDSTYNQIISVELPGFGCLMCFYIKPVESCCAMSFLYAFTVRDGVPQGVVDAVLKAVLTAGKKLGLCCSSNRLIVNMVERDRRHVDPLEEIKPIENPNIDYKQYWDSFHNNAARVNTMLMPNMNTGKIIHHMEVLYSPEYFQG